MKPLNHPETASSKEASRGKRAFNDKGRANWNHLREDALEFSSFAKLIQFS